MKKIILVAMLCGCGTAMLVAKSGSPVDSKSVSFQDDRTRQDDKSKQSDTTKNKSKMGSTGNTGQGNTGTGNQNQTGTGNQNQTGTGNQNQSGTGNQNQTGTGNQTTTGSGNQSNTGTTSGNQNKTGTGNQTGTKTTTTTRDTGNTGTTGTKGVQGTQKNQDNIGQQDGTGKKGKTTKQKDVNVPDNVKTAYTEEYPNQNATWSMDGDNYVATYTDPNTRLGRNVVYGKDGKVVRTESEMNTGYPEGIGNYYKKNYPKEKNFTVWQSEQGGDKTFYTKRNGKKMRFDKDGNPTKSDTKMDKKTGKGDMDRDRKTQDNTNDNMQKQ